MLNKIDWEKIKYFRKKGEEITKLLNLSAPIDLYKICENEKELKIYPNDFKGCCDGLLRYKNGKFRLFFQETPNEQKERFNFAHELSHFLIDEHHIKIKSGEIHKSNIFNSYIEIFDEKQMELEADSFASGLLMPEFRFKEIPSLLLNSKIDPTKKIITDVSKFFNVSITAAAISIIQLTSKPFALVYSENRKLNWVIMSEDFSYIGGMKNLRKNEAIPYNSNTYKKLFTTNYDKTQSQEPTKPNDWFMNFNKTHEIWDNPILLDSTNSILIILEI